MKTCKYYLLTLAALLLEARAFAEGEEVPPPTDYSFYQTLIMFGFVFIFFYFILWRPEQKKRKALEARRSSLKKGDRVVAVGIIGVISKINDDTVILRMVDGAKIEVYKSAVSDVLAQAPEGAAAEEE